MKVRRDLSISHAVNSQLEHEPSTVYDHVQREIQVVELDALGRRQLREQAFGNSVQVRSQRAYGYQALFKGIGRLVRIARDEVILDDEGLPGAEVARVVEGNGGAFGDLLALQKEC